MSKTVSVPAYLADEYQMLTENIESYQDPEDPDAFKNYVDSLLGQLNKTPGFLAGMPDQLAICLLYVVKVNSAKLLPLCSDSEPAWEDVKTCVNVHKNFRPLVSTLSNEYQEQLKTALLLLCFYDLGAAKEEFHAEVDESAGQGEYEHQQDFNDY
jgi:hypothetical protein